MSFVENSGISIQLRKAPTGLCANRAIPDFVIPGAMKAGTTSLVSYLEAHPQLSFSVPKEPSLLIGHDYEHLTGGFVPPQDIESAYVECFPKLEEDRLYGEASVAYLSALESPHLLAERNPSVKAIVFLRDPVGRTISSYHYCRSRMDEPCASLEDALQHEIAGFRDRYWPTLRHLNYSCYVEHLQRWHSALKPGNLLILEFEEFVREPQQVLDRVYCFLEVPVPKSFRKLRQRNKTARPRSRVAKATLQFLYQPSNAKSCMKWFLGSRTRSWLKILMQDLVAMTSGCQHPETNKNCLKMMDDKFRGMKSALKVNFGFEPQYWNSGE